MHILRHQQRVPFPAVLHPVILVRADEVVTQHMQPQLKITQPTMSHLGSNGLVNPDEPRAVIPSNKGRNAKGFLGLRDCSSTPAGVLCVTQRRNDSLEQDYEHGVPIQARLQPVHSLKIAFPEGA